MRPFNYSPQEVCLRIGGHRGSDSVGLFRAGSKKPESVIKCNFRKNGLNVETDGDTELMGLMGICYVPLWKGLITDGEDVLLAYTGSCGTGLSGNSNRIEEYGGSCGGEVSRAPP
jgi:hypothetical protein